jgi:hypothetical protein
VGDIAGIVDAFLGSACFEAWQLCR